MQAICLKSIKILYKFNHLVAYFYQKSLVSIYLFFFWSGGWGGGGGEGGIAKLKGIFWGMQKIVGIFLGLKIKVENERAYVAGNSERTHPMGNKHYFKITSLAI